MVVLLCSLFIIAILGLAKTAAQVEVNIYGAALSLRKKRSRC